MLNTERIHYLDSMRAVLMVFGILLHTANIFSPSHSWLVSSDETSIIFAVISNFINLFRMPAFFMVSGFFFTHIYLKKQRIAITDRLLRLLVPLFFIAITLNVVQEIIINSFYNQPQDLVRFFTEGRWVSHLWFLINLSIYNLIFWTLITFSPIQTLLRTTSAFLAKNIVYLFAIVIFPFLISGIYSLNNFFDIYSNLFNVTSPFELLFYSQFFVVGLFFGYSKDLLSRFSKPGKKELFTFLLAYFLSFIFRDLTETNSPLYEVASAYNQSVLILFLSSMCFFFFKHFLDYKNHFLSLVSTSSYSIYLLHHIVVVALGIIFISLPVSIYIAYPVIVVLTFLITIIAHQGISRSIILSFLINGLRPRNKKIGSLSSTHRLMRSKSH